MQGIWGTEKKKEKEIAGRRAAPERTERLKQVPMPHLLREAGQVRLTGR